MDTKTLGQRKPTSRVCIGSCGSLDFPPTLVPAAANASLPAADASLPAPAARVRRGSQAYKTEHGTTALVKAYDALVLVAFWIAFVVYACALLGLGAPPPPSPACVDSSNHTVSCAEDIPGAEGRVGEKGLLMCAHAHDPAEQCRSDESVARPVVPGPSQARAAPKVTAAPIWRVDPEGQSGWEYGVRREEGEGMPFFEPHEYDEEGRPFAMRIHLEGEEVVSGEATGRRTRKCAEGKC